jgi:hypothetical protein
MAQTQDPVRIGFITTFRSPPATLGEDSRDGFQLGRHQSGSRRRLHRVRQ